MVFIFPRYLIDLLNKAFFFLTAFDPHPSTSKSNEPDQNSKTTKQKLENIEVKSKKQQQFQIDNSHRSGEKGNLNKIEKPNTKDLRHYHDNRIGNESNGKIVFDCFYFCSILLLALQMIM